MVAGVKSSSLQTTSCVFAKSARAIARAYSSGLQVNPIRVLCIARNLLERLEIDSKFPKEKSSFEGPYSRATDMDCADLIQQYIYTGRHN